MAENSNAEIEALARARIQGTLGQIENSLRQIESGNPFGAEPDPERRRARLTRSGVPASVVPTVDAGVARAAVAIAEPETRARGIDGGGGGAEAIQGATIDFVGVEFLSRGRLAANAVGRVAFRNGNPQGTGFLVGPGLFLTNNHVLLAADKARDFCVEFDYEAAEAGGARPVTRFGLAPERCFVFDPVAGLDFTLVALGATIEGAKRVEAFGYMPLSDAPNKHMLGEIANIIQHPNGRMKQIVIRENNLVARDETQQVLHYIADTEPGSSGSPVCNNDWEPIALHHWGGPALEVTGINGQPLARDINEGVRISAIVKALRARAGGLDAASSAAVKELLALWDAAPRGGPVGPAESMSEAPVRIRGDGAARAADAAPGIAAPVRVGADGTVTWTVPIEISVRLPMGGGAVPPAPGDPPLGGPPGPSAPAGGPGGAPEKAKTDFGDRGGYEPGFIPGFVVPLPDASKTGYRLAKNRQAAEGDDPHELRYHHFSILMNAERRLAAVTAVNIDGARIVAVKRADKSVELTPTLGDLDAESMEASDDFQPDPRVDAKEQMGRAFYENQKVPGFDKPGPLPKDATPAQRKAHARAQAERTARIFQKGHIILRGDPVWGSAPEALLAEADTFFYTNAAPQLGWFNQGSAVGKPGAKGTLRWRALETWVLRNAFNSRSRISVFAGPVFADDDPPYREGSQVPMKFWKIAVWAEGAKLRSIALIADQRKVLDELTKGMPEGMLRPAAEAFTDQSELARAAEFLTSVAEIEALTRLDFGEAVRAGDVHAGKEAVAAIDADPLA